MIIKWFKPVSIYDLAFSLQRLTGIILAFYLCLHLAYLSTLSNPKLYESLIEITVSPEFLYLDAVLFLAGIYHGVNGFRIIIHELGYLHKHRMEMLIFTVVLTFLVWIFSLYMVIL
ncbi:MAG: succinate dehydrogenase [Archaeoglobaceae archaeon]|nr:succinate dehydrogenase [Archaeoglobaceae archaeon]MCX8151972.1 succinate dehydrogenase [Archaeoglobaceae archaeon]MDW8013361.1 succinate dehydrogenase [Archaeoglobaceae archaeon]